MNKNTINTIIFFSVCIILFIIASQHFTDHTISSSGGSIPAGTSASSTDSEVASLPELQTSIVYAPLGSVGALVADTDASRQQGLSDRLSLPDDAGMLFVFDQPGEYGFWMKDMHFPLDMVWISADKTVVDVKNNVSPATYPTVLTPSDKSLYVLEVNAGSADKLGLTKGAQITFDLPEK